MKGELELPEQTLRQEKDECSAMTHVSQEEARVFLDAKQSQASKVAQGVMLCATHSIVSVAVYLFVQSVSRWDSYQRLLQEGDCSVK